MESNFNNDRLAPAGHEPGQALDAGAPAAPETSPAPGADATASPGLTRFNTCRWQQGAENGNAAFCTHREVKPYAGTAGFDADAWCPECQYYKLRRTPKKRNPADDYTY